MSTPLPRGVPKGHKTGPQDRDKVPKSIRRGHVGTESAEFSKKSVDAGENSPREMVFLQTPKKRSPGAFRDCSWQRCRVHFARNLMVKVPKASQDMVAAALRSVFVQQEAAAVEAQWDQVITMLAEKFPAAAAL
jgi:hypothetical protein